MSTLVSESISTRISFCPLIDRSTKKKVAPFKSLLYECCKCGFIYHLLLFEAVGLHAESIHDGNGTKECDAAWQPTFC